MRASWKEGIARTVLSRAGPGLATGGAEEAARLLRDYGWADCTWSNRTSQISKWLRFCDEDDRCPLPATEGDVLAYIGYLSLENRVGGTSLPQYISAVSRYHILHNLPSPTLTPLVRALVTAYARHDSEEATGHESRIGLSAPLAKMVLEYGLKTSAVDAVCAATMVVFSFLYQVRGVTVEAVRPDNLFWTDDGLEVLFVRRKGTGTASRRRPLRLRVPHSAAWDESTSPLSLIRKWVRLRPDRPLLFQASTGSPSLSAAVDMVVAHVNIQAPDDCYFGSHSARIGGFNELLSLGFSRLWIMQRLDWTSEQMFSVYFDSRISATAASHWFFGHMRPGA